MQIQFYILGDSPAVFELIGGQTLHRIGLEITWCSKVVSCLIQAAIKKGILHAERSHLLKT
jgi:hypothetical protein